MTTPGALSASNPKIKRLRRLSGRRSSRTNEGAFVVEGLVLVREALVSGVPVEELFVDGGHPEIARALASSAVPVTVVAEGVLASVLPAVSAQPVAAVVAASLTRTLADVGLVASDAQRPLLVLVDVADPGNVGTLMRVAESSGCAGVVLAGSGVDLYNPKVVRSSAGSMLRLPIAADPDPQAVLVALAELGVLTAAAVARDGVAHLDASLGGAVAIVLGNEAHGLAADVVAGCDVAVTITMDGPAESLNVAMAGTVLCFEALRQRLS
ncbi:MAG TPA: RNA methyltransferase [Microthrixaceae bacterium]|nr:RNA methyltransferase [Microthrixaceae bacterium]HNI34036.1 RNA methyltransferase [Microthrixaceae bacterium]